MTWLALIEVAMPLFFLIVLQWVVFIEFEKTGFTHGLDRLTCKFGMQSQDLIYSGCDYFSNRLYLTPSSGAL
jgi:L-asparagine transporter-like permease